MILLTIVHDRFIGSAILMAGAYVALIGAIALWRVKP